MSALFVYQLPTLPQKIDSREVLGQNGVRYGAKCKVFWC